MKQKSDIHKLLDNLFPFYFGTDKNGKITSCGRSLKLIAPTDLNQIDFLDAFTIVKPAQKMWHEMITEHKGEMIILGVNGINAELMGQIIDVESENTILFVVNLVVKDAEKLSELNLQFGDFAIQDPIFDFLMLLQTQNRAIRQAEVMNRKLAEANRIAIKASETKSQFLANMSHELRTPMNGLLGMAHILMETHLDDEQKDYVKTLVTSGESMLALVNDILDLSKIEAGFIQLSKDQFQIQDLIHEVNNTLYPIADKKSLSLVVEDCSPCLVSGDRLRLRQVLLNILGNALKFTEKGSVQMKTNLHPNPESNVVDIEFDIKDTGIGMDSETLSQLFKPFVQGDSSMTKKFEGTGLGLSICKKLVQAMNGNIEVKSSPGEGSQFHIKIKLEKAA